MGAVLYKSCLLWYNMPQVATYATAGLPKKRGFPRFWKKSILLWELICINCVLGKNIARWATVVR
jgi:hypothetical protein